MLILHALLYRLPVFMLTFFVEIINAFKNTFARELAACKKEKENMSGVFDYPESRHSSRKYGNKSKRTQSIKHDEDCLLATIAISSGSATDSHSSVSTHEIV